MDATAHHSSPPLPVRAWAAWKRRGSRYLWHKALRRSLGRWPGWKRRLVYADPRDYWTLRGGLEYFREQEGQPARSVRSDWLAARVASYRPVVRFRKPSSTRVSQLLSFPSQISGL